jgi:hypothetical protein
LATPKTLAVLLAPSKVTVSAVTVRPSVLMYFSMAPAASLFASASAAASTWAGAAWTSWTFFPNWFSPAYLKNEIRLIFPPLVVPRSGDDPSTRSSHAAHIAALYFLISDRC